MGLAAGQARLLTITGRKSDCEFESMRLSHQKIALARDLADISNEYQNSLNQTKLVYDYYGTGDTSTQLSYGLLMYPSALNNYMPTTITDSLGRVTLNSKYAAAARAAGIPQEGLGTLPSEDMRNAFISGLASPNVNLITEKLAETITNLPYNQGAGFGGGATVAVMTDSGNYDALIKHIGELGLTIDINLSAFSGNVNDLTIQDKNNGSVVINANGGDQPTYATFSLVSLLSSKAEDNPLELFLRTYRKDDKLDERDLVAGYQTAENIIEQVYNALSSVLDLGDGYTGKALEYACNKTLENYVYYKGDGSYDTDQVQSPGQGFFSYGSKGTGTGDSPNNIGWVSRTYFSDWHDRSEGGFSINNLVQSYLTNFADYMNGISEIDKQGNQIFDVNKGETANSHLAENNNSFEYIWATGSEVSSDDLGQATFYDALFNQICANGWTENDRINDNEYLQQMLQNGMMFISKMKDDNYYYQGNYATDTYIKEIPDETLIAYAESKYNTEKAKLNAKEETLDLKMKNLDTEISSLTTEYDTVKNTISKQIERSFKRYSA